MASVFKIFFTFALFCIISNSKAQVTINLAVKPPFTPFISDYTNPARLQDINVSVFNQSGVDLRLKFKLTLENKAKGISISLKEDAIPLRAFELAKNEFKFVVLEEISNLYGQINQNNFEIKGASIENLILDGTIPDGIYEVCIRAFDFDAPGYSKPLSDNSPFGCFTFQVNYTDPPTDIRFNSNLLQYSFGGTVPKIGVNGALGQNYSIQFTPPALNIGSQYEYELLIYREEDINPNLQRENTISTGISSIIPIVSQTSSIPFFSITNSDMELDFNKNYYLLIRAVDFNRQALFKNDGYSTFKAFQLIDIQPLLFNGPTLTNQSCGNTSPSTGNLETITWENNYDLVEDSKLKNILETRIKIIRISDISLTPQDVFNSNEGHVLIDTVIQYSESINIAEKLALGKRFHAIEDNNRTKWVIGLQHKIKSNIPFTQNIRFDNNGKYQCEVKINTSTSQALATNLVLSVVYPKNNDTIPFNYPPIVIQTENLRSHDKIMLTRLNSNVDLLESHKYLKLTLDAEINSNLNQITSDTSGSNLSRSLNKLATQQNNGTSQSIINSTLLEIGAQLSNNNSVNKTQLSHALNSKTIPLGYTSKGKFALFQNIIKYNSELQVTGNQELVNFPNISKIIFPNGYKNNILWNGKIGIYSDNYFYNQGMSLEAYEEKFRNDDFSGEELLMDMLKKGLLSASGTYNVGMKTPILSSTFKGKELNNNKINFNFKPSPKPQQLLPPSTDNNEVWGEFQFLSVAQQWNLEVSFNSNFTQLDTVISKRIIKTYDIKQGASQIEQDLYNSVSIPYEIKKPGKYFWRVTWSNITVDANASEDEKKYFRDMTNLVATSQLMGETNLNPDSIFFIRNNYRISAIDSFNYQILDTNASASKPRYELEYPLNGDTIPFMYPPVVIKNNAPDSAYKFILSKFNSTVEPFANHDYYLIKPNHPASLKLQSLSFDTTHNTLIKAFNDLSREQLYGIENENNQNLAIQEFAQLTQKKTHLRFFNQNQSNALILGNNPTGKINLIQLISKRGAISQNSTVAIEPETPTLNGMIYFQAHKVIKWNAKFAFYTPNDLPFTSVDTFEHLFNTNNLHYGSPISPNNKQGIAFFNGNFSVGMKTPQITPISGGNVNRQNIEISFKPSNTPAKLIPSSSNTNNSDWSNVLVAQQWNIEVSNTKTFDSLIFVKSKCIIQTYDLNNSTAVMNDLYNQRKEKIQINSSGKFYYRITWSNPTSIDTNNNLHKEYAEFQTLLIRQNSELSPEEINPSDLENFYLLRRDNYRFSAIDSFVAIDSNSTNDTAVCGLNCLFSLNNVDRTAVSNHITANTMVDVGQFKMKIKTISFNNVTKTASGTGTISCQLFPAPIAVVFSQVKFNSDKRLIEGDVKAKNKTDDLISNYITGNSSVYTQIASKFIDYNQYKNQANQAVNNATEGAIDNLYNYINSPVCLLVESALNNEITMPFGLSKEVDNFPHTIAVTDILFMPTEAKFNAASILSMQVGFQNMYLGFGLSDICLTPKGIANVSNGGALELMGSIDIVYGNFSKFKILGRNLDTLGRFGNSGTRILWDCKGFKQIDLKVSVSIDRSIMVPMKGKQKKSGQVTATGHAVISSLTNWMLTLDFDSSFQINAIPGFIFTNRQATLDFSDVANAQEMAFPINYTGQKNNHWKGLYFKEVGIRLPDVFSQNDTNNGIQFNARNVIIDESGITLSIGVNHLLNLENGRMSTWKYSIDSLYIDIVNNVPRNTRLRGDIHVPIFTESFKYNMMLTCSQNFDSLYSHLNIQPLQETRMPAWFANLNLLPSSTIKMQGNLLQLNTLKLESNLNGSISIGSDDIGGLKDVRFGTLPFEGLKVSTSFHTLDSFKIHLDKLGGISMNRIINDTQIPNSTTAPPITNNAPDNLKTGGFPIQIEDFNLDAFYGRCLFDLSESEGIRIGIKFKLIVNIADAGGNAVGGSCRLGIYAAPKKLNNLWEFSPSGLNVDTIKIEASLSGAISIKGGIAFIANDPIYGNGVAGFLMADLPPTIKVGVSGMFGEVNNMRYWMFGAFGQITPGIPIDFSANVVYANSISAEVWYKMSRTPGSATSQSAGFQIGRSPSGASFVPSDAASFGFGAALGLTGPPGTPLFGDVGLYVEFNNDGGLSKLTMEGNLWLPTQDKATVPVLVNCNATIDITNQKFVANLSALVNVGPGIVRGRTVVSEGGKNYYLAGAGHLLIDVKNNEWHIKLGDPFITNGKMGFGFYAGNELIFESGGYFMMGNKLPQQLPKLDSKLKTKLEEAKITLPAQRPPGDKKGFAILAGLDANIPEKKIEMGAFYAGISVQFAMDGLLAPDLISCPKRNGVNGFYMIGKAYAVANGAIGLHIDMPMYTGDLIIAEMNAGMTLDAGAPNPYYFKGQVSVNYSVMGGLIEGSKNLTFELAEDNQCKPNLNASIVSFSQIISDISPINNAVDVAVGIEPVIALNFAYNTETKYKIPLVVKVNGQNITVAQEVKIRVKSSYIQIIENNNKNRKISVIPSSDGKLLNIRPDSFLKSGMTNYKLKAKFYIEKYNTSSKVWEIVKRKNNIDWDTTVTINFRTEEFPLIRSTDISYSTPLVGENYFKRNDYTTGKLVLKQNDIVNTFFTGQIRTGIFREFDLINGYNIYYGQFISKNDLQPEAKYTLTYTNNEVRFQLPAQFDSSEMYQFRIIREKIPGNGLMIQSQTNNRIITDGVNIKTQTAANVADRRTIQYSMSFKASKFKRMSDKIAQIRLSNSTFAFNRDTIRVEALTREPFEYFEIRSFTYPLLSGNGLHTAGIAVNNVSTTSEDNDWIKNIYIPQIYKAGDSLQKKRPNFSSPFYNMTKTNSLTNIAFNGHIIYPIKVNSVVFNYDLRLANSMFNQLNNVMLQTENLRISGELSNSIFADQSDFSIDLNTGKVSKGGIIFKQTSSKPAAPILPKIQFNYFQYDRIHEDFDRLKALALRTISAQNWYYGLTSEEIKLVTRVIPNTFQFDQPYTNDKFLINLHRNSINTIAIHKLYINNNILKPMKSTTVYMTITQSTYGK